MKQIILFLFLLLFQFQTLAQKVDFGLKLGVGKSWIESDRRSIMNFDNVYSYFGSLSATYKNSNDVISYSIEPGVIKKGFNAYDNQNISLLYVNIPAFININIYERISLRVGPEIAFLVASDTPSTNSIDFNINAGLYYALNDHISIEFRYIHGISKLMSIYYLDSSLIEVKNYNQSIVFGLAYFF